MEAGRVEQLMQTYEASGMGDKYAVEAMGKWTKGDRALFESLMRAHADLKRENGADDDDAGDDS